MTPEIRNENPVTHDLQLPVWGNLVRDDGGFETDGERQFCVDCEVFYNIKNVPHKVDHIRSLQRATAITTLRHLGCPSYISQLTLLTDNLHAPTKREPKTCRLRLFVLHFAKGASACQSTLACSGASCRQDDHARCREETHAAEREFFYRQRKFPRLSDVPTCSETVAADVQNLEIGHV